MGIDVHIKIVTEEDSPQIDDAVLADAGYEYTFDTFIVGSSNNFAYSAALAVTKNPGGTYNPLFIYGNSGLGKTHLLNAIYNRANEFTGSMAIIADLNGEQKPISNIVSLSGLAIRT